MSVKIARLRSGEDLIADVKEVYNSETERIAAIQIGDPYSVVIVEDPANMFDETGGEPFKISNPKIRFYPWTPLSANTTLYLDPNEVICVYDPHTNVLDQYTKLLEAIHGRRDDGDGDCGCGESSVSSEDSVTEG